MKLKWWYTIIMVSLLLTACGSNSNQSLSVPANSERSDVQMEYDIAGVSYNKNNVKIKYPAITGMKDKDREDVLNKLIEQEAMTILDTFDGEKDTIEMDFQIKLRDERILSIVYPGYANSEGAAHPVNLFQTTNVDIEHGQKLRLQDLVKVDHQLIEAFRTGVYQTHDQQLDLAQEGLLEETLEQFGDEELLSYFSNADSEIGGAFSYVTQDSIGISLPVAHALGDHFEMEISREKLD
ncbi:DUF4163 domain-containing protein [Paenibacillus paeoniae]|uniref:DUF4163 domain-containing protein n=1 Tax=Paenibacillus paeoniae TaxID=2292705 RepID=A0A371P7N9_9BACL|nr:DUF4163 domain-containing protein [Paenibacillus paeoniae]REK71548.1 DUF4163 domain-containing protein [Paenibacillus paeoniae]